MAASHYKRPKQIVNNQETYKAVRKSVADAQVAKKAVNASIRAPPPGFQGRKLSCGNKSVQLQLTHVQLCLPPSFAAEFGSVEYAAYKVTKSASALELPFYGYSDRPDLHGTGVQLVPLPLEGDPTVYFSKWLSYSPKTSGGSGKSTALRVAERSFRAQG